MFRFPAFAVVCLAATSAFAQTGTPPAQSAPAGPPPEAIAAIQTAATAFSQCLQTGIMGVPASVTPEAGATSVVNGCSTQRQAVEQAANALIATLPEEQRAMGQEQLRTQLAAVPAQVIAGITQMRAAPAPATAPAQ